MAETALLHQIRQVIEDFPKYLEYGTLLKSKLIDDIPSYEKSVIKAFLSN